MGSFLKELWAFLRVRKKLWLAPIIIAVYLHVVLNHEDSRSFSVLSRLCRLLGD